ncbi:unnamed protein product [Chironomus riparius]|uniref:Uncharacterized protein n=1 Tax=Chironomus riparius TaxID=315576 RepID=A0A9N9RIT2_9DIPT|nr:unnamed protein product [Chironomus riparius]
MEDYNPQVYNFSLPSNMTESIMNWQLDTYEVKSPTYPILLDHTLAVIWHLFADNGNELSTLNNSDILWALRFLESIDTKDAGDTTDLDGAIKFMRKLLISRYAVEDEEDVTTKNQTFLDTIKTADDTMSLSYDEYLNCPEVLADEGKVLSLEKMAVDVKCTKAEIVERLKAMQNELSTDGAMSLEDAIKLLEKY